MWISNEVVMDDSCHRRRNGNVGAGWRQRRSRQKSRRDGGSVRFLSYRNDRVIFIAIVFWKRRLAANVFRAEVVAAWRGARGVLRVCHGAYRSKSRGRYFYYGRCRRTVGDEFHHRSLRLAWRAANSF